jgi:F0F1-type ATP synthase assembly protein I
MKQAAVSPTTKSPSGNSPEFLSTLAMDLLNTAWRIALPVVVFVLIGIFADRHFRTAPWFTLLAMVLGFVVAGMLVKKQLASIEKKEQK